MAVKKVEFESGSLVITEDFGLKTRYPIAPVLRAVDIPNLTHSQVSAISSLANLVAVLIRTLIARDVLDESFLENDELDLDHIIYAIEQMGGAYHEPDLKVEG